MTETDETAFQRLAAVPTAMGLSTRLAVAQLERRGMDPSPLLARSGLSHDAVAGRKRVSVLSQIDFLNAVSQATRDEWIGLTLAADFDLRQLGMLYYVAASSHRLDDAIRRLERYARVASEALRDCASRRAPRSGWEFPTWVCPGTWTGTRRSLLRS